MKSPDGIDYEWVPATPRMVASPDELHAYVTSCLVPDARKAGFEPGPVYAECEETYWSEAQGGYRTIVKLVATSA